MATKEFRIYTTREESMAFTPEELAAMCYEQMPPYPEESGMLHITSIVQHQGGEFTYEIRRDQVSGHYKNLGDLMAWHFRNMSPLRVEVSYVSHTTKEEPFPVRHLVTIFVG